MVPDPPDGRRPGKSRRTNTGAFDYDDMPLSAGIRKRAPHDSSGPSIESAAFLDSMDAPDPTSSEVQPLPAMLGGDLPDEDDISDERVIKNAGPEPLKLLPERTDEIPLPPDPPTAELPPPARAVPDELVPEDPRELARRLASEAKARAAKKAPEPLPVAPDEVEPQDELTEPGPPSGRPSLADRARRSTKVSAKEALSKIVEPEPAPAPPKAKAEPKREAPKAPVVAAPAAPAQPPAPKAAKAPPSNPDAPTLVAEGGPEANMRQKLEIGLPNAKVLYKRTPKNREVLHAVWTLHHRNALFGTDARIIASAAVVLDAVERGVNLTAAEIEFGGQRWAAWFDEDRQVLLAVLQPAPVFLSGV